MNLVAAIVSAVDGAWKLQREDGGPQVFLMKACNIRGHGARSS
jgi:hypothetical protein